MVSPMLAQAIWQDLVSKVKGGVGGRVRWGREEDKGKRGEIKDKKLKVKKKMLWQFRDKVPTKAQILKAWSPVTGLAIEKWLDYEDSYFINTLTHR